MRLADDPEMARWVEGLAGTSEDFEWDDGNRTKNVKHGIAIGDRLRPISCRPMRRKEREVYEEATANEG